MSRCFPFPPPGYERKLTIDDGNLLAKEKDKERKEKKQKKDKEKKEGKEKDKEKRKDKHREKDKEKKEKHKPDDKEKKKDKKRSRDEKSHGGASSKVEKAGSNSPHSTQFTASSSRQELGRRLSYVDGAVGSQLINKVNHTDQGRGRLSDSVAASSSSLLSESKIGLEQKSNGQRDDNRTRFPKAAIVCNLNGVDGRRSDVVRPISKQIEKVAEEKEKEKFQRSNNKGEHKGERGKGNNEVKRFERHVDPGVVVDPPTEATFMSELDSRSKDENAVTGSQVIAKANSGGQTRTEFLGNMANGNKSSFSSVKETSNCGNGMHKLECGQRDNNESRGPKVAIVHNKVMERRGAEMAGPVEMGKKIPPVRGAEKNGYNGSTVLGYKDIKIDPKEEFRNRARLEEKAKQGGEYIIKLSRSVEKGSDSTESSKKAASAKPAEGITAKRKAPEANGFLRDDEVRPNKVSRTIPPAHLSPQNGRNLQQSTTLTLSASKMGRVNSVKVERNGDLANGTISTKGSPCDSSKPPSSIQKANEVVPQEPLIGSTKPPSLTAKLNGVITPKGSPLGLTKPASSVTKLNGVIVPQESSICSANPSLTTVKASGTIGAQGSPLGLSKPSRISGKSKHKDKPSSKPLSPHPDTKYLSHILSVPKMDEWSEFDDQEWLFDKSSLLAKETKADSASDDGTPQVWSKTVHIESAVVYALPYVIPY